MWILTHAGVASTGNRIDLGWTPYEGKSLLGRTAWGLVAKGIESARSADEIGVTWHQHGSKELEYLQKSSTH